MKTLRLFARGLLYAVGWPLAIAGVALVVVADWMENNK